MASNVPPKHKHLFEITIVSIVIATTVVALTSHWFHKPRRLTSYNACINNLRQIEGAKDQWAIENHRTNGDIIHVSDITPYLKYGLPVCPEGGKYSLHAIGTNATCSLAGKGDLRQIHELP